MCKLITSAKDTDVLSIGFDRDRGRRQRELTNNINQKGIYHVRVMLKDVFGFTEHHEKATYGLGYKLTLTGNCDNSVLNEANATNNAKIKINSIEWYLPHYKPSMKQQKIMSKQFFSKIPTELQFVERSIFMKEVNTRIFRIFELGTQEGINVPIWVIVSFQLRYRQDSQNLNVDNFYRLPVTSAQCIIGTEKYPDSAFF